MDFNWRIQRLRQLLGFNAGLCIKPMKPIKQKMLYNGKNPPGDCCQLPGFSLHQDHEPNTNTLVKLVSFVFKKIK